MPKKVVIEHLTPTTSRINLGTSILPQGLIFYNNELRVKSEGYNPDLRDFQKFMDLISDVEGVTKIIMPDRYSITVTYNVAFPWAPIQGQLLFFLSQFTKQELALPSYLHNTGA